MTELKAAHLKLKRTVNGLWRSIMMQNSLWVNGQSEGKYLMSGRATELVDSIHIPNFFEANAVARIYGVIAADQSMRRYIWIYLSYRNHIWGCRSIEHAYEVSNKIKQHNKLEIKERRMREKLQRLVNVAKLKAV